MTLTNEQLSKAIENFYKTVNFYQFDNIKSLEIETLDKPYLSAVVTVSRNGEKFTDKIFTPVENMVKYL